MSDLDRSLAPIQKILSRSEAVARFGPARRGRLVFTNGCFDLLHRGHVEILFHARALGDALVVGLNSDDSVQRVKGTGRPVTPESDRALVLAALSAVDAVVLFDEDTPLELIRSLQPDILVKGSEYAPEDVVGREIVEARGGRVAIFPRVPGRSTSEILQRLAGRGESDDGRAR